MVGGTWLAGSSPTYPLPIHCSVQAQTSSLSFLVVCAVPADASPSSASAALGPSTAQHAPAREAGQRPQPRAGASGLDGDDSKSHPACANDRS